MELVVVRYVDEPVAQASTSHQHYYSQPGSILAPEPQISKEQLEALIRQEAGIIVVVVCSTFSVACFSTYLVFLIYVQYDPFS